MGNRTPELLKNIEARRGLPGEPRYCEISRILFSLKGERRSFISLGYPNAPHHFGGASPLWLFGTAKVVRGATNTRGSISRLHEKSGRRPSPLLCLAPHGVSHATSFTRESGGLLPRLFNLAPHHF